MRCNALRDMMNRCRSVQSPRVLNIEDLRRRAKRRLPRVVFDYIDGGAEDESTLRTNCRAFEAVTLRPRCAVATPVCDLRATVLGTSVTMPLILAPVGSCRLMFPRGEEAAARAAGEAGIICTLSTLSGCRLEDVAAASEGRSGTNFISSEVATVLWAVSTARARPGFRPWWSRSTRQSQVSENAIFAMARKNFLVENSDQCCRL